VSIAAAPDWLPGAAEMAALVLDLPGDEGVVLGLSAARTGYRPVPLYNAIPLQIASLTLTHGDLQYSPTAATRVAVDVAPIAGALRQGTEMLRQLSLPADAPPVFMLDANRRGGLWIPSPGAFDNRSVSFTTDFPSATFLRASGISKAVLVQQTGNQPQSDLAHTLRRWQEGGILIEIKALDQPGSPVPCTIEKPSRFGWFMHRFLAAFGLRPSPLGGFGGEVPFPGGGGG
jgi:hypothetical protein